MNKELIIEETVAYVKSELVGTESGHDWWHIYRVWKNAQLIASGEIADGFVIELGALLHDIADAKFHNGDEEIGPRKAESFLKGMGVDEAVIEHVKNIIRFISFKNGDQRHLFNSKELEIVQDADRLDAIGAIGVARAFNYGGFKNRTIYDPFIKPNLSMTKEEYKKSEAPTINHFYEKLLLLKDKMNTETGKKLAQKRHEYLENFLDQFFDEWEGKS
ncbi:HD domain-containing protein [Solitalea canadensis]|uniref:Putative HD superfamily hydrolase n=1 Tax=Solitalea canadensis (strain ATCC 29591 / DSM 3403 / JCM 21819 / LMG 8368 / NBRC 15130 / NCIMB 12057 / USAM 9D) TaxID=929556 RepID=H8KLG5_SOLCM|nr:HD domain-containing protein [Solitalea canadensis]AFD08852.1 putative HD superfamily hydrolase [Solitalea canadensis DSM 3403]